MLAQTRRAEIALGTFSLAGCPPFAGLVLDHERVLAVRALLPICEELGVALIGTESTLTLIESWDINKKSLRAAADTLSGGATMAVQEARQALVPISSLKIHPPLAARQIFMSGANYFKHVVDLIVDLGPGKTPGTEGMDPKQLRAYAEELMQRRRREGAPYFFTKPVSVLSGAYDPIQLPAGSTQPDWELELVAVMGAAARDVRRANAMRYVAGFTIANDITCRDWVWAKGDMKALGTDWVSSKCAPGFLPLGPYIVPAEDVPNPQSLQLTLKLNGEIKQDESTSDMLFDVPRLIEHLSHVVQLLPGDVICTGSPSGNGTHYKRFLQPGDVVESTIAGLGKQRNSIVAAQQI
jgi:2-keto-4-pentenoate hydratase/2-oxohepta-3-ene-1,7-dioic acid hydratase in catechol pathway